MRSIGWRPSLHFGERLENRLVQKVVEDFVACLELLDALAHAVVGNNQDTTQHRSLFGFLADEGQPV